MIFHIKLNSTLFFILFFSPPHNYVNKNIANLIIRYEVIHYKLVSYHCSLPKEHLDLSNTKSFQLVNLQIVKSFVFPLLPANRITHFRKYFFFFNAAKKRMNHKKTRDHFMKKNSKDIVEINLTLHYF